VVAARSKVRYRIDPKNPYPNNFTGHISATLADGRIIEERQPSHAGGARAARARRHRGQFALNARHGGWGESARALRSHCWRTLYDRPDRSLAAARAKEAFVPTVLALKFLIGRFSYPTKAAKRACPRPPRQ